MNEPFPAFPPARADNRPVDFVYLEINDAFETLTGLKRENVVGKKVSEAIPETIEAHPELFEVYGKVALTGKARAGYKKST